MLKLRHIALSAFEIINDSGTILIDPFVSLNAQYNYRNSKNISDIFVTHGHYDHVGQTVEIAKNTETDVTAIVDVAAYFKSQGVEKVHPVGVGSWLNYDWGRCVFLPAIHTCTLPNGASGGVAASILFEIDGVRIFHAGDTSLTVEFKGINEVYHPDVALLPICRPIWNKWIEMAILSDAIKIPNDKNFAAVKWIPQGFAWVDPLKEQKAQMEAVRCGFKSRAEVVSELGYDVEEIDEEIKNDNQRAQKMGLKFDSVLEGVNDDTSDE